MQIRRARTTGQLLAAGHLFDGPTRPEWASRFLDRPGHHLFLAYDDGDAHDEGDGEEDAGGRPIGFVSGVEMIHPDKGVEMFLYELAVDEAFRRRGTGRALVATLAALARELGCYDMWVAVDTDNAPAHATYRSAGAAPDATFTMLTWDFTQS